MSRFDQCRALADRGWSPDEIKKFKRRQSLLDGNEPSLEDVREAWEKMDEAERIYKKAKHVYDRLRAERYGNSK